MATDRIGRTTGDTGAATTVGGEVSEERTAVSRVGTAAGDADDSLSLSACTSSLSNSDNTLKKQNLFQTLLLSVATLLLLRCKIRQDSTVEVIDLRAAFPLSGAVNCRLKNLFAAQDIEGWMKLLPQTVTVEEVVEFIFVLAEQQLNLIAEVESLKSRKEAFALLLEEKKELLKQEIRRNRESELEKAEMKELDGKLRCELGQLRKAVVQLNEQVAVLLGELEQFKRKEVEGDAKLRVAESTLKQKWELERDELLLRVSELEAAKEVERKAQLVHVTEEEEARLAALEEELAKSQKELSGSREKAAILMEMCKQNNARIEELLTENSKLKSRLTAIEETSKTYDISAVLKENSNLRAALKTVEQMKMEVENEKVAIQDQLLEYQRRCGVFDKPTPPIATFKTGSSRTGLGKARAFADGIVRGTLAPSSRACPFCKADFGPLGSDESEFMDHVNNCQGLSASETS